MSTQVSSSQALRAAASSHATKPLIARLPGQWALKFLFVYFFQVGYPGWRGWLPRVLFSRSIRVPSVSQQLTAPSPKAAQPA